MCEGLKALLADERNEERKMLIQSALDNGKTKEEIAEFMGLPLKMIESVVD